MVIVLKYELQIWHAFSTQLKFIENGSRMAKRIQYIKINQMINVNEILKKKQ